MGFLTRGCFRRCAFCVNRNTRKAVRASPLREFWNRKRKKVCLLDDNFLACPDWKTLLTDLIRTCGREGTSFEFKQGLDIRLLTTAAAKLLKDAPLHGELIFAFDSLKDATKKGLRILRKYLPDKPAKCYVLCGYEGNDWRDIASVFRRLQILWEAGVIGYLMRHENCYRADSMCFGVYTQLARWCNQPKFQRSHSFREFCEKGKVAARDLAAFERVYPAVGREYFDMRYWETCRTD